MAAIELFKKVRYVEFVLAGALSILVFDAKHIVTAILSFREDEEMFSFWDATT